MTYAKVENGEIVEYPLNEGQIRERHRNTSFSLPFTPPEGYVSVVDRARPIEDHTKNVVEGLPELIEGVWVRNWVVTEATAEEIEERNKLKGDVVRRDRDIKLMKTDWTQLPDSTVDGEVWREYRQNLRDIPQQLGFPWNVEWPTLP